MPGLLDTLKARPANEGAREQRPSVSAPLADYFTRERDNHPAPPVSEPESSASEESALEDSSVSTPLPDIFATRTANRWSPATKSPLEYEGSNPWNESWTDRTLAHMPAITIALLFLAVIVALSFFYRVQFGQSLVRLGEKISGQPAQASAISAANAGASTIQPASAPLQTASTQPPPVSSPNTPDPPVANSVANAAAATSPSADAPKDSPKNLSAYVNDTSADGTASAARDHVTQPPVQKSAPPIPTAVANDQESGQAEYRAAEASLREARTPEAKAKAAQLLWTAVSNGSSDAEVELAGVYGRGDGVRKNCQQARILLAAATDKHNPLAGAESAELRTYGCR